MTAAQFGVRRESPLWFFLFACALPAKKRKNESGDSRRTPKLTLDHPLKHQHVVVRPAAGGGDFVPEGAIPELHLDPGGGAGKDKRAPVGVAWWQPRVTHFRAGNPEGQ